MTIDNQRVYNWQTNSMSTPIKLNDILRLPDLKTVKIRLNTMVADRPPIEWFNMRTEQSYKMIVEGHHWNFGKKRVFKEGDITLAFIPLTTPPDDRWLLVFAGRITKDLHLLNAIGYEYESLTEYENLFGRLVVRYHNTVQAVVRKADSGGFMDKLIVETILSDVYNGNLFPGYDNVMISWKNLEQVINNDSWKTALQNQKGVYLITDRKTGKLYVGSATGDLMLLGRWQSYIKTGHGGNKELKSLSLNYIKDNFWFSILEVYRGSTDDDFIIQRENHWKEVLRTRTFGYNAN